MRKIVRAPEEVSVQSPREGNTENTSEGQGKQVVDISADRSPSAFDEALTMTRSGDWILYHAGLFAAGAHKASAAAAYEAGLVNLVQRRRNLFGYDRFEYIAQRTTKKWKKK